MDSFYREIDFTKERQNVFVFGDFWDIGPPNFDWCAKWEAEKIKLIHFNLNSSQTCLESGGK